MNRSRASFARFVEQRLGRSAGPATPRSMFARPFGAPTLRMFWYYWNPVYGYVLRYFCYAPLRRVFGPSISLLLTFAASGFLLHDAVLFLVLRLSGVSARFFPVVTVGFVMVAIVILVSERAGVTLRSLSPACRCMVHACVLLGAFATSLLFAAWVTAGT
ncbi:MULTISPECIES: hypothetical protein [Azotobacter]|nr:hypothetical protein [Azotobacter vinelandii]WKN22126.1 hypothetical protein AVAEIV_000073 [Azotobacter vinelandii]